VRKRSRRRSRAIETQDKTCIQATNKSVYAVPRSSNHIVGTHPVLDVSNVREGTRGDADSPGLLK
jgi:hypothetical protein